MLRSRPRNVALLASISILVYFGLAYFMGPLVTSDGEVLHILALTIVESGYGSALFEQTLSEFQTYHPINQPIGFYRFYLYFLAGLDLVFGQNWANAHLAANAAAMSLTALICIYLTSRKIPGWLYSFSALIGVTTCWEYLQWETMTQSDPLFFVLVMAVVALTVFGLEANYGTRRRGLLVAALLLAIASLTFRPTGAPLVVFAFIAFSAGTITSLLKLNLTSRFLATLLLATVPFVSLIGAAVLFDPTLLPESLEPKFQEYHLLAHDGVIVNGRPESSLQPGSSYFHFLVVLVTRFTYFFSFYSDGFSPAHNLLNLVFYIPFYFFVALSLIASAFTTKVGPGDAGDTILLLFTLVVMFALFHAATLLDFDWRYRSPIHPVLSIIAAHGIFVAKKLFLKIMNEKISLAKISSKQEF
jgi:hypothetical protein